MKNSEVSGLGLPNAEQQHAANYAGVVHALLACEDGCNACADACQGDFSHSEEFRRCIRRSLDCADVCGALLRMLMRQTGAPNQLVKLQIQACAVASQLCAEECRLHADGHAQCQVCAEICQHCSEQCLQLIDALSWNEGSTPPFLPTWT